MPGGVLAAVATVGGAVIGSKASSKAAKSQAAATNQAAQTAAQSQTDANQTALQQTQMGIEAQERATQQALQAEREAADRAIGQYDAAQGVQLGELDAGHAGVAAQYQPMVDDRPLNLYRGGIGVDGAQRPAYDDAFNTSVYRTDAANASQRGINALNSTYAARGMGGITSGKAMRAAADWDQEQMGAAHTAHLNSLTGLIDRSDNARAMLGNNALQRGQARGNVFATNAASRANAHLGYGAAASNAFGQQGITAAQLYQGMGQNAMATGNNLGNIALQRGQDLSSIYGNNAANQAGFIGDAFGALGAMNTGAITKRLPNVFGGSGGGAVYKPKASSYAGKRF